MFVPKHNSLRYLHSRVQNTNNIDLNNDDDIDIDLNNNDDIGH